MGRERDIHLRGEREESVGLRLRRPKMVVEDSKKDVLSLSVNLRLEGASRDSTMEY